MPPEDTVVKQGDLDERLHASVAVAVQTLQGHHSCRVEHWQTPTNTLQVTVKLDSAKHSASTLMQFLWNSNMALTWRVPFQEARPTSAPSTASAGSGEAVVRHMASTLRIGDGHDPKGCSERNILA